MFVSQVETLSHSIVTLVTAMQAVDAILADDKSEFGVECRRSSVMAFGMILRELAKSQSSLASQCASGQERELQ